MQDKSGRYWLVYNGEIFNYKELKTNLKQKGIRFSTESDSEVLLQAYIHYGEKCVDYFNGFFSFAIYDQVEHRLFAARDRLGIKPFYYCLDENGLSFGSELTAVKQLSGRKEVDHRALHLYFQLTYIPAPYSIISGINKLKPGHFIVLSSEGHRMEKYFDLKTEESPVGFKDATAMVRSELERSVKLRLVADVPVGTFLSGGIDSSIVSSIAARHSEKLQTFSVGFPDSKYQDESINAEKVAQHIGSNHHKIPVSNKTLAAFVAPFLDVSDEPFADSSALAVYILSQYTSQHLKVALSGDGADELFGGYRKHRALIRSAESSFTNRVLKAGQPLLSGMAGSRNHFLGDTLRKAGKYGDGLKIPFEQRYWDWLEWTPKSKVSALLRDPLWATEFEDEVKAGISTLDFNSILTTDLKVLLPNDMLTKADRMSMAHGLEVRTPFLDHELVQKVQALPFSYKADRDKGKLLLREAFKTELPAWVFDQSKKGFEIPVEQLLRSELKGIILELSSKELIEKQNIFNYDQLQNIIRNFLTHSQNQWATTLWSFLIFQKWWLRQPENH